MNIAAKTLVLVWLSLVVAVWAEDPAPVIKGHAVHATRILARVQGQMTPETEAALHRHGLKVIDSLGLVPGLMILDDANEVVANAIGGGGVGDPATRLLKKIGGLRATGLFAYVEPDYRVKADLLPTDASFLNGTLWGLRNNGQAGGAPGADVGAVAAWDITTGSTNVIVAIIDTGVRYTHQDLAAQMWRNSGEIAGNGFDDDNDGYIDNIFGINAIAGTGDPMDQDDHGTHVAGTIGAAANNNHPHVGVAWKVQLMACKFLGATGGNTSDAIRCVNFAVSKGARILNNSWGGGGFSQALQDAIVGARDRGVLFVAAAGNESANTDTSAHYPSSYPVDNIISVAAIDRADKLADFSNYGAASVHLAAPGAEIYSSTSGSDTEYQTFDGTSMATPHVVGVAALMLANFPDLAMDELRLRLLNTVVQTEALQNTTVTGGRINAFNALNSRADGLLEINVGSGSGNTIFAGRTTAFLVRVTDLYAVTNATVVGATANLPVIPFANNGLSPDRIANDAVYTTSLKVPTNLTTLTLTVVVSATGKTKATNVVNFAVVVPPGNDEFDNATSLAGINVSTAGSSVGATKEPGEPSHAGDAGGASIWFNWTAPSAGIATIKTDGSSFDTLLGVYTGSAISGLARIASDDDSGADTASLVTFNAVAGTTYHIAVDGYGGEAGAVALGVFLGGAAVAPANDNFASAMVITTTSVTGSNAGATKQAGEPNHAGNSGGRSVWWTWSAAANGPVTMKTDGSSFDTALAVYTGTSVSALVKIADDDDSGEGARSLVTFDAVAGTTYRVAVDGFDGVFGNITLTTTVTGVIPAPANDAFANRAALATGVAAGGVNTGGSKETNEPDHAGNSGGRSVWWTWTAPAAGRMAVSTAGSAFDSLLGIYSGSSVSALTLVASNDNDPAGGVTSRVAFDVTAGTTYQIAVDGSNDGFGAAHGIVAVRITPVSTAPPPSNDNFASRSTITGSSAAVTGTNVGATPEAGEAAEAKSVWWTWTAPAAGVVTMATDGSVFDTILNVYTGSALGSLALVAADDDSGEGPRSLVRFLVTAGTAYQIKVVGFDGEEGAINLSVELGPPDLLPPNDDFANRIAIAGANPTTIGANFNATKESGEPNHADNIGGKSVWWTWTAPNHGTVTLTTAGSSFDTELGVYTGAAVDTLTRIAANDDASDGVETSRVVFNVNSGGAYQIAVDGYNGANGSITLALAFVAAPPGPANDNFGGRAGIPDAGGTVTGTNVGASRETGEPDHAGEIGGRSVWWTWTAPTTEIFTIKTDGSAFDTLLGIYTGNSVAALTQIVSDDDNGEGPRSLVRLAAIAGTTYQIAVDGYTGAAGAITLEISSGGGPANDNFVDRAEVTGFTAVTGSNVSATREQGEPNHAFEIGGASVWWKWTAPATGLVTIKTDGSLFDTLLAVYTGSAVATLTAIASDDDSGEGSRSLVRFTAVSGTTYAIAVDGYGGGTGSVTLSIASGAVGGPANDDFANRAAISGFTQVTGANDGASSQLGEPRHAGELGGTSVWWAWTAPVTGTVIIKTDGSSFDTLLAVYTGNLLSALTVIAADDEGGEGSRSRVSFTAVAGVVYQIAVDGYDGETGSIMLTLAGSGGGTAPENDQFANRTTITGYATVTGSNVDATKETGEPAHASNTGGRSVWWTWTAPASGQVIISTEGSLFDTVLGVYTGSAVNALTMRANNDDGGAGVTSFVVLTAVGGTVYQIAVDGFRDTSGVSESGDITLAIIPVLPTAAAVDAPGLTWTSGGNRVWLGIPDESHDGVDSARSGSIDDSQSSFLQTSVTGPGQITFWWNVSSEEDFDFLTFAINGATESRITGETGWQQKTVTLGAGPQALRWTYAKDGGFSDGADRGWLDQVVFTPASVKIDASSQLVNGSFRLIIGTPGGPTLDLTRVEVYATSDLSLPLAAWTKLGHAIARVDGALQMDDPVGVGSVARFYVVVQR